MTLSKILCFFCLIMLIAGEVKADSKSTDSEAGYKEDDSLAGGSGKNRAINSMNIKYYRPWDRYGKMVWLADHPES